MNAKDHPQDDPSAWLGDEKGTPQPEPMTDALDALYAVGPDEETVAQAQANLRQALSEFEEGVIYYDSLPDTLIGEVFVAVGPQGLLAISINEGEDAFVGRIHMKTGAKLVRSETRSAEVINQLREYMRGNVDVFDFPLDLSRLTKFQRNVLTAAMQIAPGAVATYAEIARRIGKPRAFRAVGQALSRNPIPIIIPCHRVISSDGTLGGYQGNMRAVHTKATLLKLEGVTLA